MSWFKAYSFQSIFAVLPCRFSKKTRIFLAGAVNLAWFSEIPRLSRRVRADPRGSLWSQYQYYQSLFDLISVYSRTSSSLSSITLCGFSTRSISAQRFEYRSAIKLYTSERRGVLVYALCASLAMKCAAFCFRSMRDVCISSSPWLPIMLVRLSCKKQPMSTQSSAYSLSSITA